MLKYYTNMDKTVYIIHAPPGWLKTPPLSLAYLRTYLRNQGAEARIIDLNLALFQLFRFTPQEWLTLDKNQEQNIFGRAQEEFKLFFDFFYREIEPVEYIGFSLLKRNAPFSFALAKEIKKRFPEKTIIYGGPHTLALEKESKLDRAYRWVIGEGEIPLHKIVSGDAQGVYRFEEIENLDRVPFLDFNLLNLKGYSQTIPLLSSRGCPCRCNFCFEKLLSRRFRYHSPRYMVELIKTLLARHRINNFVFCDSMFNFNNEWLAQFCELVIKDDVKINWEAQIRVDKNFTLELAKLIKQSGCFNLFAGLESGCDKTLNNMNKGFDHAAAGDFFQKLNEGGLNFEVSLIVGYPGESESDFNETLDFLVKNKKNIPKIAQVNPFVDYLDEYPPGQFPSREGKNRAQTLLKTLVQEKMKYTKSFINNLVYEN